MDHLDYLLFLAACLPLGVIVAYLIRRTRGGRGVKGDRVDKDKSPGRSLDSGLRTNIHNKAGKSDELSRREICIKALLEDRYGRVFDETGTKSFHYEPEEQPRQFQVMGYRREHKIH